MTTHPLIFCSYPRAPRASRCLQWKECGAVDVTATLDGGHTIWSFDNAEYNKDVTTSGGRILAMLTAFVLANHIGRFDQAGQDFFLRLGS
jgi:hypothetical protein